MLLRLAHLFPRKSSPLAPLPPPEEQSQPAPNCIEADPCDTDMESADTDAEPTCTNIRRLLAHHTVDEHAQRLWSWLQENGYVGGSILATDLMQLHREMCRDLEWLMRAWSPVGCALRRMTTGRKTYIWEEHPGYRRRVRAYALPPAQTPGAKPNYRRKAV